MIHALDDFLRLALTHDAVRVLATVLQSSFQASPDAWISLLCEAPETRSVSFVFPVLLGVPLANDTILSMQRAPAVLNWLTVVSATDIISSTAIPSAAKLPLARALALTFNDLRNQTMYGKLFMELFNG